MKKKFKIISLVIILFTFSKITYAANDEDIYDQETLEEFEKFESDEVDTNAVTNVNRQYNPVRDDESFFVRLFKKRTDRI